MNARLDQHRRRRRLLLRLRPRRPQRRLRGVAGGLRCTASTSGTARSKKLRPEPTEGQPAFRFHWNAPLIGERPREGHAVPGRQPRLPADRPRRALEGHQPRPLDADPAGRSAGRQRRRDLRRRLHARRVAAGRRACSGPAPTTASCGSPRTAARHWTDSTAALPAGGDGPVDHPHRGRPSRRERRLPRRGRATAPATTRRSSTGRRTGDARGRASPATCRPTGR